jgi:hypothetical protein
MAEKVPILVVLGIDIDGKPHASRFVERDAPFVQRAAELMGFHVIRVRSENAELHVLAEGLPPGKIFATGRAFVPFVARAAFDKLATLVEGGVTIEGAERQEPLRSTRSPTFTRPKRSTPPTRCGRRSRSAPSCWRRSRKSGGRAGGRDSSSVSMVTISPYVGWIHRRKSRSRQRAAMWRCATPAPIDQQSWGPRLLAKARRITPAQALIARVFDPGTPAL